MPTTVTKTIGTGGDYSTPQAWEDACPANLVTADQIWKGACLNQEFVATAAFTPIVTIGGQTTDATRYVELTAASGASFADHADKLSNPLRYDATKGAAFRITGNYVGVVSISTAYTRINRLQINNASFNGALNVEDGVSNVWVDSCILQASNNGGHGITRLSGAGVLSNCLLIANAGSSGDIYGAWWVFPGAGSKMLNCTVVRPSDVGASGSGFTTNYGSVLVQNTAFFGFASLLGSFQAGSNYNASDLALGTGANNQASKTYTNQFENTLRATQDFRVKTGADLIDTGTNLSGSGITTDIVGITRTVPHDIGAWESSSPSDALSANSIAAGAPVVGAPTVGQTHSLTASNVTSGTPASTAPVVALISNLSATTLTGSVVVGSPVVGQTHVIGAATTATGAPVVDTPVVGQVHGLSAPGIAGGAPVVSLPSLAETNHSLLAAGIVGGASVIGSPTIRQTQVFGAASIISGAPTHGDTTIAQTHAFLTSALVGGAFRFTAPLLNRVVSLPPEDRVGVLASQSRTITVTDGARGTTVPVESRNAVV